MEVIGRVESGTETESDAGSQNRAVTEETRAEEQLPNGDREHFKKGPDPFYL